ncbi:MAG: serine/threonine-protein kinase, partial [Polyangiales bacterium]
MAEHKDHRRSTEGKAAVSIAAQAYIGQVLDQRYVIEAPLGEGSTGIVYRARHAVLDKPFAVKILRRHLCANATAIQRFRQEAMITAWIGSPHIVDMMDFGTLPDGSTYCVMEYLEGMSLAEAVAQAGRMPVERVLHIARQLLQGLAAAHDNGVIHRDLKSENIFLTQLPDQDEGVKILDFGIAKIGNQTSGMTQNGQIFGTPHYMSPEQCSGL